MSDDGMADVNTRTGKPQVRAPDTFGGQRSEVKRFLLQCDLYLELREADFDNETDKVYFAVALLRGPAADWAEPFTRDRLDRDAPNQRPETRIMFSDFDAFKQALVNMFGDIGEDRRAAAELLALKQTTTVVAYAAKFQQLQAKARWDDRAAVDHFYSGLNDRIKDQMSMSGQDRPSQLPQMIRLSTDIGDRIAERAMEKRGTGYRIPWGHTKRTDQPRKQEWPQPMDLSVAQTHGGNRQRGRGGYNKGPPRKKAGSPAQGARKKDDKGKCFNCQKAGHWARECKQPRRDKLMVQANVLDLAPNEEELVTDLPPLPEEWIAPEERSEIEHDTEKRTVQQRLVRIQGDIDNQSTALVAVDLRLVFETLPEWSKVQLADRVSILGIINNITHRTDYSVEARTRLFVLAQKEFPMPIKIRVQELKRGVEMGWFQPSAPGPLNAIEEKSKEEDDTSEDSASSDEGPSYDTEDIDNDHTPDRMNLKYHIAWVQRRLEILDFEVTLEETAIWLAGEKRTTQPKLTWTWSDENRPTMFEFAQDLLERQLDRSRLGAVHWIKKWRQRWLNDMKEWAEEDYITEEISDGLVHRVASYEIGFLMRVESARWMVNGKTPDGNIKIHETRHWSLCTDDDCLIHTMEKYEFGYWPSSWRTIDREGKAEKGEKPHIYHSDFDMKIGSSAWHHMCSRDHRGERWTSCYFGPCPWHREMKRLAGYWPEDILSDSEEEKEATNQDAGSGKE
jgi:hypothetical protein